MSAIAIQGFGRIGRSALKAALRDGLWTPRAITDIRPPEEFAPLFEVDSNYGRWPEPVGVFDRGLRIGDRDIPFLDASDGPPDWGALGVDVVVDCTHLATVRTGAQVHLDAGAKQVLVSAPSKTLDDCDAVLLKGVNLDAFDAAAHRIVSMASCTTNALAPVVKVLLEEFGIAHGVFSTVHAYTNTQVLVDQPMRERRDSWAASENVIPSASGAAKALRFVWPDLQISGKAYRVPVRTGSIAELNVVVERSTSADEVNEAFHQAAARAPLKGVLDVLTEPWASSRAVGDPHSSIVDGPLTEVHGGTLVSVAAWYDNEMAYATRLAEVAAAIG